MGLFGKVKEMLFEEEEYTEPIKIRDEETTPKIVKLEPEKEEVKEEEKIIEKVVEEEPKDITPPPMENTFQFPVFDEEEFTSNVGKINNNALEYERKKTNTSDRDFSRLEKIENTNVHDKKKFTPSPIISPVYGILNQDYRAEDIVQREDVASNIDIDSVRKKAFEAEEEIVEDVIDEPVVTFFEEKEEKPKSRSKKQEVVEEESKTIDEVLEEASEEISLEDTLEMPALSSNLDVIEEELEKLDEVENKKEEVVEEVQSTEDADLYELIDSMYEDREEA